MNFMWQPQARHFGDKYQILTGVLDGFGCTPEGAFYDLGEQGQEREMNDPFVDDNSLRDFNADKRAAEFLDKMEDYATHFREDHVMIPWGCDYSF
jgi:hypothetical protein